MSESKRAVVSKGSQRATKKVGNKSVPDISSVMHSIRISDSYDYRNSAISKILAILCLFHFAWYKRDEDLIFKFGLSLQSTRQFRRRRQVSIPSNLWSPRSRLQLATRPPSAAPRATATRPPTPPTTRTPRRARRPEGPRRNLPQPMRSLPSSSLCPRQPIRALSPRSWTCTRSTRTATRIRA